MRTIAAAVGVVLALALFAPPAGAVEPPAISARGDGTTDGAFFDFTFDVAAGPNGENPTGNVSLNVLGGAYIISGPPTCLVISGRTAIIGMRGQGTGGLRGVVITAVDNGGPDSGLDSFDAFPSFEEDPHPITCVPQEPSGGTTQVVSGDIVVNPLPTLRISDARVVEGDAGRTGLTFTVRLSRPSARSVTVGFFTANGTAMRGSDFVLKQGTFTFAPGQTVKRTTVMVKGDVVREPNETLSVVLFSPTSARIADPVGAGVIVNDD